MYVLLRCGKDTKRAEYVFVTFIRDRKSYLSYIFPDRRGLFVIIHHSLLANLNYDAALELCKSLTSKANRCGMSAGNFFKCVWK